MWVIDTINSASLSKRTTHTTCPIDATECCVWYTVCRTEMAVLCLYHNTIWFPFHERKNRTMTQEQVVHCGGKEKTHQHTVHGAAVAYCTLRHTFRSFCITLNLVFLLMYRIQGYKVKPLLSVLLKQETRLASPITQFSTTLKANTLSNCFFGIFPMHIMLSTQMLFTTSNYSN